jgi:hypothetical protein
VENLSLAFAGSTESSEVIQPLHSLLQSSADDPECSRLAAQLAANDLTMNALADPFQFSLEEASELALRLAPHEAALDVRLLRLLFPDIGKPSDAVLHRVIDLIEPLKSGVAALPLLLRLITVSSDFAVSKLVRMIGRIKRDPEWLEPWCLENSDPRIRANAVEALWGLSEGRSVQLLTKATRDPHHRVVANAWVGLHLSGDSQALDELDKMVASPAAGHRASGAWALAETRQHAKLPVLRKLASDTDPQVRSSAIMAIVRLRKMQQTVA